jgi:hypothetical protein
VHGLLHSRARCQSSQLLQAGPQIPLSAGPSPDPDTHSTLQPAPARTACSGGPSTSHPPPPSSSPALVQLWGRFRMDDTPIKAARHMRDLSLEAVNHTNTTLYDGIQKLQQNIHSESWQ